MGATQDVEEISADMRKMSTNYCAFVTISNLKSRLFDTMPIVFSLFLSL